MTKPTQYVLKHPEYALEVQYPEGDTETMFAVEGMFFGVMNGKGPFPLDLADAETVCQKYDVEIIPRPDHIALLPKLDR